jgi:3-hydroxymyristoyl/3-hydroxydecanoyl-(acyl carrier protein) dehydratase
MNTDKMTDKLNIQIIEKSDTHLRAEILFAKESGLYDGHFPELPLLPGVVQAHLAIRLFEEHSGKKLSFGGFKNMKFFSPIFPDTKVTLQCDLQCNFELTKHQLTFRYFKGETIFSKGVVVITDV